MYRLYEAVARQLANIHTYPPLSVASCAVAAPVAVPWVSNTYVMSPHAATMELKIIKPKENRDMDETDPPDNSTSPYAIKTMLKFLKIVYTGIERYRKARVLVYIIPIKARETGDPGRIRHAFSFQKYGRAHISLLRPPCNLGK